MGLWGYGFSLVMRRREAKSRENKAVGTGNLKEEENGKRQIEFFSGFESTAGRLLAQVGGIQATSHDRASWNRDSDPTLGTESNIHCFSVCLLGIRLIDDQFGIEISRSGFTSRLRADRSLLIKPSRRT